MAFEVYIIPASESDKRMPIHYFNAIVNEYIAGQKTKVECLSAIETYLDVTLTNDEKSDLQTFMTAIDGETGILAKKGLADELYRVLILAEASIWYTTRALLKARLSWI